MQSSSAFNLMFDMDAMFDTRMGTLLLMREDIPSILPLQTYRRRTMDDWETLTGGLISNEAFNERYAKRDIYTLRRSIVTGMVPVLMNYIDTLKERFFRGVDISSISVDINTWPYVLPGPIADSYQNCLRVLLPAYVKVNILHMEPVRLTPTFMKAHYNGWVTYDLDSWMKVHEEELLGVPVNELAVITPKLFLKEPGEFEVGEGEVFSGMDKHGLLEMIMEDYLHIEHVPVSDFCFLLPRTYKLPDEEEEEPDPQMSSSFSSRKARSEASTD
ncbi:hypothetical protein D3C87_331660 [compost metagenome]